MFNNESPNIRGFWDGRPAAARGSTRNLSMTMGVLGWCSLSTYAYFRKLIFGKIRISVYLYTHKPNK